MIRKIVLPAILFLAIAVLGASVANAIVRRYALHALEGMAADGYKMGQGIRTAVEEISQIFQEYEIEVPGSSRGMGDSPHKESRRIGDGRRYHADLTDEQRIAIREKVAEMRESGAKREEIRTTVVEMLKEYGIEVPGKTIANRRSRLR